MDFATDVAAVRREAPHASAVPGSHARAGTSRGSGVGPSTGATLSRRRSPTDAVDRAGAGHGGPLAGDLPARVHRRWSHRARPRRRTRDVGARRRPWLTARCGRTRPSTPSRPASWPTACSRWTLNPAPILLVHHGDPELRLLLAGVSRSTPDWRYLDRAGQRQRIWAIRSEDVLARIGDAAGRCPVPARRRSPPLRGLPASAGGAPGHRLGRRSGDARRPGRHPPLPRRHPPDPSGNHPRRPGGGGTQCRCGRVAARPSPRARGARQHPPGPDRRRVVAHGQPVRARGGDGRLLVARPGPRAPASPGGAHRAPPQRRRRTGGHESRPHPQCCCPARTSNRSELLVESGGLLPEKATSFQPKPSLGVLMRPMTDA